jgi:adenosylcobinamide kinase/adenosylcobinamide-phosphate guanylyltransferase
MKWLVTGGARSGKSAFAETIAQHYFQKGIYIATAEALDHEMSDRIERHRSARACTGFKWRTIEQPHHLSQTLHDLNLELAPDEDVVILVDCLTIWLSNRLLFHEQAGTLNLMEDEIERLLGVVRENVASIIFVTNEVGSGIVPAYPLGRQFRDLAGIMNRRLALLCDDVFGVISGIPISLKQHQFDFPEMRSERKPS